MLFRYNMFAFAALYLLVNAQTPSTPPSPPTIVDVGFQGDFYTPQTVTAAMNATICFEFFGDVHTVTQSSFEDPCAPIPGGFHSGYIRGFNLTAPVQIWNLIITDDSAPIWFFCAQSHNQTSHCRNGMVGAINPPSQPMYDQFKSAAKLVTTIASVNPTPILTGQGAFALSTPTPSYAAVPTSSSPTTSSTVTPTSTSSSTPSPTNTASSRSHVGAIVGGSIGGSVGFIGLVVLAWFFFLRQTRTPAVPDDSLRYHPFPDGRPSEAFAEVQWPETLYPTSITSATNSMPTEHFLPVRPTSGPVLLQPPYVGRQEPAVSDFASSSSSNLPSTSGRNVAEQASSSNIDMRTLAQEVAALLSQNPSLVPSGSARTTTG